MFGVDSRFLLTSSNNEALMCRAPFSPVLQGPVSSCQVGMLCKPSPRLSQAYGGALTCWLQGTTVRAQPLQQLGEEKKTLPFTVHQ